MNESHSQTLLNNRANNPHSDLDACKKLIRHGSHSFFLASLALPKRVAIPATALYAFCRVADDLIDNDLIDKDQRGDAAIQELCERLDAIYAGAPKAFAEDRAMSEVVLQYRIPRAMPDALIEGLSWDVNPREYHTLSDVYRYAARVAGSVGAMMALIMGTEDKQALARACDLGVAMQLTNIARDIGEDARMGRLYLPRQWFEECGLDADAWLADPHDNDCIAAMCERLLNYADMLYRRADAGIAVLPLACRPGIRAARLIYADIGRVLVRRRHRGVNQRAVVSIPRKLGLLCWAPVTTPLHASAADRELLDWPALHENRFLLKDTVAQPKFDRIEWLFALFKSLDERSSMVDASKVGD